ncbi:MULTISPECIES: efflux RND transporter permease subunit [Olivibacter]|uniref:Efflux RND transporter permease subunit n=2 Tax=Olivibacter TaxID=376469 RepID=A0ABV6HM05_9SPHI|nr:MULTISPECIES: CusA/CzcA family heavy metal efflux RND transporter [Olivibacter]MCL4640763.1 CusA/CzcA family heavy metal efflux RND transporter [Olivibacter sp. UJ_SKK_5.1]MDX3914308.1 CusA/CzcA family heavy metal efflux RND transporter [Pseudosphingobacterium sp.]QEL02436.1 efflux RND transporter permease subunit [Olivibacter sp. LS-1]
MIKLVEKIVGFSLKNQLIVFFFVALLIAAGVYAYKHTPIEAFPDVTNTRARIITQWPGRSAEEIEKFITLPISKEMNTIPGKTEVRSISLFGLSVITVNFKDHIEDFYAQQYTANRLRAVDLPEGAEAEIEPPYGATGEIFRYVIKSEKKIPIRELSALQNWVIERELLSVDGVADIVSFGGEEKIFEIRVNPAELANYNLTALDVYDAVEKSNINVGGDVIQRGDQAYVVRGVGLLDKVSDIASILIKNVNGVPVLVKNVADVQISSKPRLGQAGLNEQDDLIEGIVVMLRGENPSEVIERLKERIQDLNDRILPKGVKIEAFHDRTHLVEKTVDTVTHNLIEGIVLVSVVIFLFLFNWRTTVIVASVIPLAFLFAILMLRIQGLPANLISIGAIDFGLLLEGTMVIVEHVYVSLDKKAKLLGMERFNKIAKGGIIRKNAKGVAKSILFAQIILIIALMPIFTFQKVEGKMFAPLAFTLGYALLGSLLLSLTYVPAMCKLLLNTHVVDRHNPVAEFFRRLIFNCYQFAHRHIKTTLFLFALLLTICSIGFTKIGTEFIPELNEGAIYIRATLPNSVNLDESVRLTKEMKEKLRRFQEVKFILTQTGRPNDGTDPTGFFNIEFHVQLKDDNEWRKNITKEDLLEEMEATLNVYPGINFGFSQPIMDNVEEYVAGVKSSLVAKVYGDDLYKLEQIADSIAKSLNQVKGIEDLLVFRNIGLPELRIRLSEARMARYGVSMRDAQAVVEMAIGGKAASTFYDGEKMFDIRVRYDKPFRDTEEQIKNILVPSIDNAKIPLYEIADIGYHSGPAFIYRQGNSRYIAVGFSVRGRDLGSAIKEAQDKVTKQVSLPSSYRLEWAGDFENQQRALSRLAVIVPVSLLLIAFLLYLNFGNLKDTLISLITIPFAFIGGFISLWLTGTIFGISAGIGFIILFGVGTIDGIILISVMKSNLIKGKDLSNAISEGVYDRIRPVFMIAIMGSLGLLPAALSQGMGSEIQKPLAIMIVGGLLICMILSLVVLPQVFYLAYKKKK